MSILKWVKQLRRKYGWVEYQLAKKRDIYQSIVIPVFRKQANCQTFVGTVTQFLPHRGMDNASVTIQKILSVHNIVKLVLKGNNYDKL